MDKGNGNNKTHDGCRLKPSDAVKSIVRQGRGRILPPSRPSQINKGSMQKMHLHVGISALHNIWRMGSGGLAFREDSALSSLILRLIVDGVKYIRCGGANRQDGSNKQGSRNTNKRKADN